MPEAGKQRLEGVFVSHNREEPYNGYVASNGERFRIHPSMRRGASDVPIIVVEIWGGDDRRMRGHHLAVH